MAGLLHFPTAGDHLYFWSVKDGPLLLFKQHLASRQVQLAYLFARAAEVHCPTWALDVAAGAMYLKPDSHKGRVLCVQLSDGHVHKQPTNLQLPGELAGVANLCNSTPEDGHLLMCT